MSSALAVSAELLADFEAALRPRLSGDLRMDAVSRALYATDASLYQISPVGVLIPKHPDDVQAAMEAAARYGVPVLPRGGGSSLAGQAVGAALVIDFTKHLDAIHEIDAEAGRVRVEPGLTLDRLNAALHPHGWMVGPDPSSGNRATLGGMVATNATGTHSILYGNVVDHIHRLRVLLAGGVEASFGPLDAAGWQARIREDGAVGRLYRGLDELLREQAGVIEQFTPRHWRRNSGYRLERLLTAGDGAATRNVAQLLCGSEGTLAVTTEIELNLVRRPERTVVGVVHYRTRAEALRSVTTILGTEPSAVELFDGVAIAQTRRAPGFAGMLASFIEGEPGAVLLTEYFGRTDAELTARLDDLERTLRQAGEGYAVVRATTPEAIANVWNVRKEGLGLIMGVKGDYKPVAVIEDASVPVEHLADYIEDLDRLLQETQTPVVYYAHASAGCLHVRPFINTKDAREVEKMREISLGSMELVAKYGGSVSSEHGDGIVRGWLLERFLGPELTGVYREVKRLFDPQGLLNPGKVLDTPPMTENLRMGPTYRTIPVLTALDWSEDGGFAASVELCNGNGACRKLQSGAMCPSFMATREEAHSTRGRANALRAALSGELPPEAWTGPELYEVLDLCVQCKACKTECPSNVDMAKMKTEWLHQYWQVHEMPLRTKLFAHLPQLSRRMTGTLARLANTVNRLAPVRWMLDRTLGISRRRSLPAFAAEPFHVWFRKQTWRADGPQVVLYADTFSNYHHPEVARAAARFLDRIGLQVVVPDPEPVCCGRPLLSKGLVTEAQQQALRTVEALHPYAAEGLPIIGLEPSCILTFRDEFLNLLPGDAYARDLAEVAVTFEEYVARLAAEGRLDGVAWTEAARTVLLHGHCHQKALVGTGPAVRCLSLPPNYRVEVLDTSCCGMAGAFGYEAEHVDVSLAMAERRLAPAVRAAGADTLVAAAGTSCRAQIEDAAGRTALHPAQILLDALAG